MVLLLSGRIGVTLRRARIASVNWLATSDLPSAGAPELSSERASWQFGIRRRCASIAVYRMSVATRVLSLAVQDTNHVNPAPAGTLGLRAYRRLSVAISQAQSGSSAPVQFLLEAAERRTHVSAV